MDYELIFWIVAGIASVVAFVLLMVIPSKNLYVDWMRNWGDKR